jgi:alpha-L-fucosidase
MIPRFGDARDGFWETRYGLFIHWGIYAVPAWHEQLMWRGRVRRAEYAQYLAQFNPTRFDPDAWLDLAQEVGMRYLCLTTKHHDGFCLWDTAQTAFKVTNTPYGRDILAQLAQACQRRNVPLCLYYSVVDWHQPNYPNQNRSHEMPGPEPGDDPNIHKYLAFLRAQVRELCTQYGQLHSFWWDMNVTEVYDPSINAMIRELQPGILINNRGFDEGDFSTPERDYGHAVADGKTVDEYLAFETPVEACQSVGRESWGYKSDEDYYSDRHLMRSIDGILAKGGNYLLNVGPQADGSIPQEAVAMLRRLGAWYGCVKESLLEVEPASHLTMNRDVLLTRRGNTLYVHLIKEPTTQRVLLKPLHTMPRSAILLNTGEAVEARVDFLPTEYEDPQDYLRLRNLPVNEHAHEVLVVKLAFDEPPA